MHEPSDHIRDILAQLRQQTPCPMERIEMIHAYKELPEEARSYLIGLVRKEMSEEWAEFMDEDPGIPLSYLDGILLDHSKPSADALVRVAEEIIREGR